MLCEQSQRAHARISRHDYLLRGHDAVGAVPPPALRTKMALLVEELRRISARRRHLDRQLAWTEALWTIDQALAHGALGDLRTLEAGLKAYGQP